HHDGRKAQKRSLVIHSLSILVYARLDLHVFELSPINFASSTMASSQRRTCMFRRLLLLLVLSVSTLAQQPTLSKTVQEYVRVQSPKVTLTHVRIIDGTGAPAADDQNIVIESGKIAAIQEGAGVAASPNVAVLDLRGYTVMPGIVGMHNHLYYIARPDIDA